MIGYLQGTLLDIAADTMLIDVQGVGYEVLTPQRQDLQVPLGQPITLYIHTHAREDALNLFGFPTKQEKELFLRLIKVSGVGAKTALGILTGYAPDKLAPMIARRDTQGLCTIKGIGKKAAEKIVLELADQMESFAFNAVPSSVLSAGAPMDADQELVSALINLGYKRNHIEQVLAQQTFEENASFDQKFRQSLQSLSG
jgi:Holliday junction DNA helicase RuvA